MGNTHHDILTTIKEIKDSLPAKQRQLCNYILLNYKAVGMATVAELAKLANVGTTTVMRLVASLNYTTYNDFKKDLFSVTVLQENSSYQNIKNAFGKKERGEPENSLTYVSSELINVIQNALTPQNFQQYEAAVEMLVNAKHINIFAQRSSKAAAFYAEYSFSPFLSDKICQLSENPDFLFDKICRFETGDVLFLICNWPCSVTSLEAARFCSEKSVPIILITNSSANPITKFCNVLLDTDSVSSACLLTPALLIIESLSFELAQRTLPTSTEKVEALEKVLKEKKLLVW